MSETFNKDKFIQPIKEIVREVLNEKADVERDSKMEELLARAESTIRSLTEALTEKDSEIASLSGSQKDLQEKVDALHAKASELEAKLAAMLQEKKEIEDKFSLAERALAEIETIKKLEVRMSELEAAKLVKSGEKRVSQMDKVKSMTDEEFASYKEELIDLRNTFQAELEAEKASEVKEEEVLPADIESAREDETSKLAAETAAILNVSYASSNVGDEYKKYLGEAMAARLRAERQS